MFLNRDADPSKDDDETNIPRCSMPELYALAENFNKESKKSNRLKVLGISPGESQKILDDNLKTVSFTSGSDLREAPQPVFTWKVVRKDEEKPVSMTELLHRSLLTGSLSQIDKLWKSQQRLARYGIPPPSHTFPYDILLDGTTYSATAWKKTSRPRKLSKLGITHIKPEKFIFEDRISEYLLVEPDPKDRIYETYPVYSRNIHEASHFPRNLPEEIKFLQLLKCPRRVPIVAANLIMADTMAHVLNYFGK